MRLTPSDYFYSLSFFFIFEWILIFYCISFLVGEKMTRVEWKSESFEIFEYVGFFSFRGYSVIEMRRNCVGCLTCYVSQFLDSVHKICRLWIC